MAELVEAFLAQRTPPNQDFLLPVDSVEALPRHRDCV